VTTQSGFSTCLNKTHLEKGEDAEKCVFPFFIAGDQAREGKMEKKSVFLQSGQKEAQHHFCFLFRVCFKLFQKEVTELAQQ
jgi:hypothetical protein